MPESTKQAAITFQVIRGEKQESYDEFSRRIFSLIRPMQDREDISGLKVVLTDAHPPSVSVIPFRKSKIAAIEIRWKDKPAVNPFSAVPGVAGAFHVTGALPVAYQKTWETERTPGICLLTLFRKREDISYDSFIQRWHNGHTPLSLEIHPLWHYSRNVVNERWGDQPEWYDGIVEEHCRTRSELLNPFRFFGSPFSMLPNMIRVYRDVRSFLNYASVEPYLTSEHILL